MSKLLTFSGGYVSLGRGERRKERMRKKITLVMIFVFGFSSFLIAQEEQKPGKFWKVSIAYYGAATTLDATSSYGLFEANRFLRSSNGKFGARGAAVKGGVFALTSLGEYFLLKKLKSKKIEKIFSVINIEGGTFYVTTAVGNFKKKKN